MNGAAGLPLSGFSRHGRGVRRIYWVAYQNRDLLNQKAQQAAEDLGKLCWPTAAAQFHQIAVNLAGTGCRPLLTDYVEYAERLIKAGRMDLAIMKLKQAIRIAPAEPVLYRTGRRVAGSSRTAGGSSRVPDEGGYV